MKKLENQPWWDELLSKKDDHSLSELSEMFGCSSGAITNALRRNGLTRTPARSGRRPSKGSEPSEPVLRGPRASTAAKLKPFDDQLGRTSDLRIAELAGVTPQTVARYRRSKSIPPANRRSDDAAPESTLPIVTVKAPARGLDAYEGLMGKIPDDEVAQIAGVTAEAVAHHREASAAPAVSADPAPQSNEPGLGLHVYKVSLGDESFYAIAHDLVDLAAKLKAADLEAVRLKQLGAVRL